MYCALIDPQVLSSVAEGPVISALMRPLLVSRLNDTHSPLATVNSQVQQFEP